MRTSDRERFPGFSATVVCVDTALLQQFSGKLILIIIACLHDSISPKMWEVMVLHSMDSSNL